jgi:hypothetical protein
MPEPTCNFCGCVMTVHDRHYTICNGCWKIILEFKRVPHKLIQKARRVARKNKEKPQKKRRR